ncbi:MAG: lysylphosphatidylglycerol synthase transmembrane domain-containing protein [Elusimicrobiota bacterium]|nr:lysylphosphatidylglycerol synthase transmembrane domain-containing protein [Elusimicrobiota bacterium]
MKKFRILFGFLVSIILLIIVFRKIDFFKIIEIILQLQIIYLIGAFIVAIIGLVVRSKRWQILLSQLLHDIKISLRSLFDATCFGLLINNILPFRAGDFAQALFLGYRENISKSATFSTVVLERLLDLIPPATVLISSTFFVLLPKEISQGRIFGFVIVMFTGVFLIVKYQLKIVQLLKRLLPKNKLGEKINQFIEHLLTAISFLKNRSKTIQILLFTILLWCVYGLGTYFCLLAFDIKIGFLAALLILCITAIGVMIPSSPGYIGTWEFFCTLALSIFRTDKNLALSFAIIYHLLSWLPPTLLGLIVMIKSNVTFAKLKQVNLS